MKIIRTFLSENFHFLAVKFSVYLNRHVFVMKISDCTDIQTDLSLLGAYFLIYSFWLGSKFIADDILKFTLLFLFIDQIRHDIFM